MFVLETTKFLLLQRPFPKLWQIQEVQTLHSSNPLLTIAFSVQWLFLKSSSVSLPELLFYYYIIIIIIIIIINIITYPSGKNVFGP